MQLTAKPSPVPIGDVSRKQIKCGTTSKPVIPKARQGLRVASYHCSSDAEAHRPLGATAQHRLSLKGVARCRVNSARAAGAAGAAGAVGAHMTAPDEGVGDGAVTKSSVSDDVAHLDNVANEEPAAAHPELSTSDIWARGLTDVVHSLPRGDALDSRIVKLGVPSILNFLMTPLVGAVDTFWVGQMRVAPALAGQAAANQVFNSLFWIMGFLPSVISPAVAKAAATGDEAEVRRRVGEGLWTAVVLACLGMILVDNCSDLLLRAVMGSASEAYQYAEPYLSIRAFTFLPALVATVGFAAFRGRLDVKTPLKISVFANVFNMLADPLLIFRAGYGVAGAAMATCLAEGISGVVYVSLLVRMGMARFSDLLRAPPWKDLKPLLLGGFSVQLRSLAMNAAFLMVTRSTLGMDPSGTAAAAHAVSANLWQLGGVVLLGLSTTASILIPQTINTREAEGGGLLPAKKVGDRMLAWGFVLGCVFAVIQLASLPLLRVLVPIEAVHEAAVVPSVIGALLQPINGMVFVGEGLMSGHEAFGKLARNAAVAALVLVVSLQLFGSSLVGVWSSFWAFNITRLFAVLRHHFFTGPLGVSKVARL